MPLSRITPVTGVVDPTQRNRSRALVQQVLRRVAGSTEHRKEVLACLVVKVGEATLEAADWLGRQDRHANSLTI